MSHFCVTLEGTGIHILSPLGGAPIVGFYSVVRLRAENSSQASSIAASQCRERLRKRLERSGGDSEQLSLAVESVLPCSWLKAFFSPGGGFIFFPADDA